MLLFPKKATKGKGCPSNLARVAKVFHWTRFKILTPKQKLQRLPITQVKAGNTSENLLNEIRMIIYCLYREKEFIKKVYSNIMNLIQLSIGMDTIFMNSKYTGTSDLHRLLLNLTDKINLKRSDKCVALSNLSIYYTWKIKKDKI